MLTITDILTRHNVPQDVQNDLIKELRANYLIIRKRHRKPPNRFYRGVRIIRDGNRWRIGENTFRNLKAAMFHVRVQQSKFGKGKLIIKRPELAPYYVKIWQHNVMVYEDRKTYQVVKVSAASSLEYAAQKISEFLFIRGVRIEPAEVEKLLKSP